MSGTPTDGTSGFLKLKEVGQSSRHSCHSRGSEVKTTALYSQVSSLAFGRPVIVSISARQTASAVNAEVVCADLCGRNASIVIVERHQFPHFILVQPHWVRVSSDEFFDRQTVDLLRAGDLSLLAIDENRHEFLFPLTPCSLFGMSQFPFPF